MKTFIGDFKDKNYVYSSDTESLRAQLISILNEPFGSRWYYPSYGTRLNEYRFSVMNYFTINMIGQEIKNAISLMSGVRLSKISYYLENNQLHFSRDLLRQSEIIKIGISVSDGVAF